VIAGVQLRTVESRDGIMAPADIERRVRIGEDIHCPKTGLICLENAHSSGRVIPMRVMREVYALAQRHAIPVHLDGARVFNAATALGVDVREIAACADSVMFCLSKGLAAPVGSMLAGSAAFIAEARRKRKLLGGGMRQVGVLAAACLVALEDSPRKLAADHANARFLAEGLERIPGIQIDPRKVATNIVVFDVSGTGRTPAALSVLLKRDGVLINGINDRQMRAVTHYDVTREDCAHALDAMAEAVKP
jgi:threonine aldolase